MELISFSIPENRRCGDLLSNIETPKKTWRFTVRFRRCACVGTHSICQTDALGCSPASHVKKGSDWMHLVRSGHHPGLHGDDLWQASGRGQAFFFSFFSILQKNQIQIGRTCCASARSSTAGKWREAVGLHGDCVCCIQCIKITIRPIR